MRELPSSGAVGAVRARELLAESASLRRAGQRPAGLWPPLVIFGIVALVAAPLGTFSSLAASLWWIVAAPAAFAAVALCGSWQARRRGQQGRPLRMTALGAASFAAGWLACLALTAAGVPIGLAWAAVVAAAYLGLSWLARSRAAAVVAVAISAVGIPLGLAPVPGWSVLAGVGTTMTVGGLALRYGPES